MYDGSTANNGTVYKLSPMANGEWTERILHSFAGSRDGANPEGGITLDAKGNIYGTTFLGGNSNLGGVFELTVHGKSHYRYSVLWAFNGGDGANP